MDYFVYCFLDKTSTYSTFVDSLCQYLLMLIHLHLLNVKRRYHYQIEPRAVSLRKRLLEETKKRKQLESMVESNILVPEQYSIETALVLESV